MDEEVIGYWRRRSERAELQLLAVTEQQMHLRTYFPGVSLLSTREEVEEAFRTWEREREHGFELAQALGCPRDFEAARKAVTDLKAQAVPPPSVVDLKPVVVQPVAAPQKRREGKTYVPVDRFGPKGLPVDVPGLFVLHHDNRRGVALDYLCNEWLTVCTTKHEVEKWPVADCVVDVADTSTRDRCLRAMAQKLGYPVGSGTPRWERAALEDPNADVQFWELSEEKSVTQWWPKVPVDAYQVLPDGSSAHAAHVLAAILRDEDWGRWGLDDLEG